MPEIKLETLEEQLRNSATRKDMMEYLDILGEGVVEMNKKLIELDNKMKLLNDDIEEMNFKGIGLKERKKIERMRQKRKNIVKEVTNLREEFNKFKNELGNV